jgi:hypothetical protein
VDRGRHSSPKGYHAWSADARSRWPEAVRHLTGAVGSAEQRHRAHPLDEAVSALVLEEVVERGLAGGAGERVEPRAERTRQVERAVELAGEWQEIANVELGGELRNELGALDPRRVACDRQEAARARARLAEERA